MVKLSKDAQAKLDRLQNSNQHGVEVDSEKISKSLNKQQALKEFGVNNLDDISVTTDKDREQMANETLFTPILKPNAMSERAFNDALRKTYISDPPVVYVRSAYQPNWGMDYIDLCYFDKKADKIVGLNRVPLFYRDMYKHAYGLEKFTFFCHENSVEKIFLMLKKDKGAIDKSNKDHEEKRRKLDAFLEKMDDSVTD